VIEVEAGTIRRYRARRRWWSVVAALLAVLVVAAGALAATRAVMLRESVLPGVTVAGIDVGGLERTEARAKLQRLLAPRLARRIRVTLGGESFSIRGNRLFRLDAAATERAAFNAGRDSFLARLVAVAVPVTLAREVDPVLVLRRPGRRALARQVFAVTRPPVSARIRMERTEPVVVPGRFGTAVDLGAIEAALRDAALAGRRSVSVEVSRPAPAITAAEAATAAATAKRVVAAPVEIFFRGDRVGRLSPAALAELLRFRPAPHGYDVLLGRDAVARAVEPMVASQTKEPVDATFAVEGTRVKVVRSQGGTKVAARKAARVIFAAALGEGTRTAGIVLTRRGADFTTADAKALGIRERISTFTTDMGESSPNRIWNVQLLGRYLDGTIIQPGEVFSYNKVMGPRTEERGFREGQMIFGGVLIPSIGGGVCQTATTIFNAAFEAGLPISERRNHSFYISHYPVGRDATVAWGGQDLVFKNDLKNAILIKASGTTATFTVSFYGTKQGRRVVASTSEPTNYTQPRLQYAVDPTAPPRSLRTTEAGGPGFDVSVHRKVYQRGKLIREDDFFSRYTPQNPTAVYGPGRTPPGPYFTLPTG
jgi:vancomycin resistance protein YoaR